MPIWIYSSCLFRTCFPLLPPLSRHTSLLNSRKSAETLPHRTVKLRHALLETGDWAKMPWNFWNCSDSDIDPERFCLHLHRSLFFGRKFREKIVQHLLQAIPFVPFPFVTLKKVDPHQTGASYSLSPNKCTLYFPLSWYGRTCRLLRPFSSV